MINRYVIGLFAILASCTQPVAPPPPGGVKFTVGDPYQAGGEWFYPREMNDYDATGLAIVIPDGAPAYTADNESYDPNALAAASPVLQLPCIVTVTNLVNGRSVDVRVNDRGPMQPGRVLAVTPRVARLLSFPSGGIVEVEVKLNQSQTMALQSSLGAVPKLTAAPVAGITAQSLAPPGGGSATGGVQQLGPSATNNGMAQSVTLSGTVTQGAPGPGPLWVQVPGFGSEVDAFRTVAKIPDLPARVVPVFGGDRPLWAVNAGPYHSVADADAALQQMLQSGVADPEIIVR
jgi:rare lipoprotein A